ncbi:MAG TPA: hypothetical protein VK821_13990 [Dehalococcoidia bacterium]|nr:hypothetical protein [Dehalococcoidia bacterium]
MQQLNHPVPDRLAPALFGQRNELADLPEWHAEQLRPSDEEQTSDVRCAVDAVAIVRTSRSSQQPEAFVVTHGVWSHPDTPG